MYRALKFRIYPTPEQSQKLSQVMGCAKWWWNFAFNLCNETYKETGKGLMQIALPEMLVTGKTIGIDLGLKDFAVTYNCEQTSKYPNLKHIKKPEINIPGFFQVTD